MNLASLSLMVKRVNVHEAKSTLSELLRRVEAGDEVVVARAGRPVARLVPYLRDESPRQLGGWEGRVEIADDFDATPSELVSLFEGDDGHAQP